MRACAFTPENAGGLTYLELTEMNTAHARLSARRERATSAPLDAAEHERLCALIRDAVMALRHGGWAPTEVDIIGEVERRELAYPPQ
jgi:hypothetical protein